MITVVVTDLFAAAFCLAHGVEVVGVRPGRYVRLELDDTDGQTTALLEDWYGESPVVDGQKLATSYRQVCGLVRANKVKG